MNQSRKMTEGAMLLAIYIALIMASLFIPVLSIFAILFTPVPFVLYAARHSWKPAIVMVIGALIISAFLVPPISLPLAFLAGFGGILIGQSIHTKVSAYETVVKGTAGFAVAIVVLMALSQLLFQVNVLNLVDQSVTEGVDKSIKMSEQISSSTPEQVQLIKQEASPVQRLFLEVIDRSGSSTPEQIQLIKQQAELVQKLFPASMIFVSGLFALFTTWISFKLLNRIDKQSLKFPRFRELRMPAGLVWLYLAAVIFAFATLEKDTITSMMAINALTILEVLVLLQGLSFLFYFSWKKKISAVWPVIITIVMLFLPPVMYLVRLVGIMDIGLKLRDRISSK